MNYHIFGIFPTINNALSAAKQLEKAGYVKQFIGFTQNSKIRPEALVEDHFIDENEVTVYTPNLNRAHKAKNILLKFGAEINKIQGLTPENDQKDKQQKTARIPFGKRKTTNLNQSKD